MDTIEYFINKIIKFCSCSIELRGFNSRVSMQLVPQWAFSEFCCYWEFLWSIIGGKKRFRVISWLPPDSSFWAVKPFPGGELSSP